MGGTGLPAAVSGALVVLGLVACSTHPASQAAAPVAARAPAPAATVTTPPPPSRSPTLTAPPDPVDEPGPDGLRPGDQGPAVRALQDQLANLKYDPGRTDGHYGPATILAVTAFQKLTGMPRTGAATPDVLAALAAGADPPPLVPDGGPTRVEIDFPRQVLLYWRDGALVRILAVSTGHGRRYCAEDVCGVAVTPSGSFRVERRIHGLHKSRLGLLYNPLYFHDGYAIHGSPSVPAAPASHGCVRIPMHASQWFYDSVANGTPVYLAGGKIPAVALPPATRIE